MGKETSIIFDNLDRCCVCGRPRTDIHHVFEGWANRRISDKHHLVIPLCHEHHEEIHKNKCMMDYYRALGQRMFEEKIGTRNEFYAEFGRYFLEEE